MSKALVILSGGLDSTTCAAMAMRDHDALLFLSFDYGQRHIREIKSAEKVAAFYAGEHMVVKFDARAWGGSALTDDIAVPTHRQIDASIPPTYVPGRNTIFLSFALAVAEARDCDFIYLGINALDYSGYPDCRPEYLDAFRRVSELGLKRGIEGHPIAIEAPLLFLTKADIVRLAVEIGAPLDLTWSCYVGAPLPCGTCDSCLLRAKGFEEAGLPDPVAGNGRSQDLLP